MRTEKVEKKTLPPSERVFYPFNKFFLPSHKDLLRHYSTLAVLLDDPSSPSKLKTKLDVRDVFRTL